MSAKAQALDRVLQALSPALASELERVVQETRDVLEQEFQGRLQAAVRESETASAAAARVQIEHAVEETKDSTRRQVTADLEQQFNQRLEAVQTQLRNEAAAERSKFEAAATQLRNEAVEERRKLEAAMTQQMTQQKNEWSGELSKLEDELAQWRAFAEVQRQLAEVSTQPEILSRFLRLSEPFAAGLALYVVKGDGLALWKSKGKGAFPEIISKETTDPESYFRIIAVRGKTVGALCASPSFKTPALDFLAGSLERAIEVFGLKLRTPVPKPAAAETR